VGYRFAPELVEDVLVPDAPPLDMLEADLEPSVTAEA
jgi:hypothetical protein